MMNNGDPAAEWRRLEELYRQKSDDELQVVADEAGQLSDMARDVLQREMAFRGWNIVLAPKPNAEAEPAPEVLHAEREGQEGELPRAEFSPDDYELCAPYRVWDREEAEKIKSIYNDAGIASYLGPDLVENVGDYRGGYDKGVEFKVRYLDRDRAISAVRWAFRDEPPASPDEERESDYRCPKCKSGAIVFEELERDSPEQPDYLSKFNWHCDACGHEWTDDGVEKEA